jgi:hypothetical protein
MAKFPVQPNDMNGIVQGLNYVLSGPAGLGQNFAGFSSYDLSYLTGNYRTPFSTSVLEKLYVAPINISTCYFLDDRTIQVNFAITQTSIPFVEGNQVILVNVTGDSYWDGRYQQIGVITCTTTYCTIRVGGPTTGISPGSGGYIYLTMTNTDEVISVGNDTTSSTDCNARVTVTSQTDRVFVSGQLELTLDVKPLSGSNGTLTTTVQLNRYYAVPNTDPVNPDYKFILSGTIAQKVFTNSLTYTSGNQTLVLPDSNFSTILDQPGPNYYWYILELTFFSTETGTTTDFEVYDAQMKLRSLSAQVVKQ